MTLFFNMLSRLVCGSGGSEVKASACNAGDLGSIPGLARSPGEGKGNPLQYSCLENPTDRGAWRATVHGATESHMTEHARSGPLGPLTRCRSVRLAGAEMDSRSCPGRRGELLEEASCLEKDIVQNRDPWREGFRFQERGSAPGPGL